MIKRTPLPINISIQNYNKCNHHEYSEYIIRNNETVIDRKWFLSLTPYIQNLIKARIPDIIIDDLVIPHDYQENHKNLATIYKSYQDGFDYNIWYSSVQKYIKPFKPSIQFFILLPITGQ